jgi:hypothetical protein
VFRGLRLSQLKDLETYGLCGWNEHVVLPSENLETRLLIELFSRDHRNYSQREIQFKVCVAIQLIDFKGIMIAASNNQLT